MLAKIVEVAHSGRYLSHYRGFLKISEKGEEVGRVALDDIGVLIANAHGLSYSNDLLVTLAKRNIPVVLCGSNCVPAGWLLPCEHHHVQAERMQNQLEMSQPLKKRLWKQLVISKIRNQAALLANLDKPAAPLNRLAVRVRSGDPENLEAQAARKYWLLLFGKDFRRDRNATGVNSLLNYGYTIIRSAVARGVLASGLHPSLGVNHRNRYNAFQLADDVMEPFRPLIDYLAHRIWIENQDCELSSGVKQQFVDLLYADIEHEKGVSPTINLVYRTSNSLAAVINGERNYLELPDLRFGAVAIKEVDDAEWISIDVDAGDV